MANESKTVCMALNDKDKSDHTNKVLVGNCSVARSENTKLLGMQVEDSQKWNLHINETVKALNYRLFQIRRIKNHIPPQHVMKVIHSLWMSKVRYGITRWHSDLVQY